MEYNRNNRILPRFECLRDQLPCPNRADSRIRLRNSDDIALYRQHPFGDELRITANQHIAVELKAEDTVFVLAQRAKRFIETDFLFKE